MSNGSSKRVLPHLPTEVIANRDTKESLLCLELSRCWAGDDFDQERANHLLCGFATEIYDIEFRAYRRKSDYSPNWLPEIVSESIHRVLVCADKKGYPASDYNLLLEVLQREIRDHIGISPPSSIKPPLQQPVVAQIKIPNEKRNFRSISSRSAVEKMERYIETSGENLTQFAQRVQVDPKTLYSFRKTGKVDKSVFSRIAKEMGLSPEQLLGKLL